MKTVGLGLIDYMQERKTPVNWNEEFANAAYIPDGDSYPNRWQQRAQAFRNAHNFKELDCSYGEHPRQRYDLFIPSEQSAGLVFFIHGGFWIEFDKSYWSHLAKGFCENRWTVAIPSYILTPEATIPEITEMIGTAIETCATITPGPIILVGHSAGGHLVSRMACVTTPLSPKTRSRVRKYCSLSGVHDLTNLLHTNMNSKLLLSTEDVLNESPAKHEPLADASVLCWVGAQERPEFQRQSTVLFESWLSTLANIEIVVANNRHHFDVFEPLTEASSTLTRYLCGLSSYIQPFS